MCTNIYTKPLIPVSQHGRSFVLRNVSGFRVTQTDVDNCAIKNGIRCDFMFEFNAREIFVELKGSDVCHAANQILRSINLLSKVTRNNRSAVIVSSRVPAEDTSTMIAKRNLKKIVNDIKIKNKKYEISI